MPDYMSKSSRRRRWCTVLGVWGLFVLALLPLSDGQERSPDRDPLRSAAQSESVALLKRVGSAFASVMERVSPGVVGIQTERRALRAAPDKPATGPLDPFGEDFFDYFFRRRAPQDDSARQEYTQKAQGSGFLISADGHILTNNHVVADADKIMVELIDGRRTEAQVVGADPESDVAVVRIQAGGLTPVALGNSDALEVGEWVLAIGNPLGLSHTVTAGIVSAKHRSGFNVTTYENFIQTDAAVNMGNSGGPLVNLNGEAVGMNTFILGPAGGNIGIGFAIPINVAREVADQLRKTGAVERGYLGVIPQDLTPELAEAFGLKGTKGTVLSQVTPDSPAARAGLAHGDVVPEFDGVAIDSATQFRNLVASRKPGATVPIVILRDGERRTIDITLDKRPSADELRGERRASPKQPPEESPRRLGLTVQDLTPEAAPRAKIKQSSPLRPGATEVPALTGVIITKVAPGSEAAQKGLREGYVITEVNRRQVNTEQQFREAVSRALGEGRRLLLLITDGRVSLYVVLNPSQE
jgi:serine protease Do